MNEKIRPEHLQRAAYLYIRQSTAHQVRFHLEGQKRQYQLSQRARELGFTQGVVIDEDLGRSGSGLQERPGFGRLLAAVCQGAAGAVVAGIRLRKATPRSRSPRRCTPSGRSRCSSTARA